MTQRSAPPRRACTAATILLLCLLPVLAGAQQPLVVDEHYRVQPGDVLAIQVLGEENLGGARAVGPGGAIALPLVGSVPVNGKSLREISDLITKYYKDVIRRPFVTVALDEGESKRRVYVGGRVEKPGSIMLPFGATLPDAVVGAGFGDESDLARVTLRRTDGTVQTVDLSGLRTDQPLDTAIALRWDDRVHVPERASRLILVGQVAKPGSYTVPLGRSLTMLELLTTVGGGLTPQASKTALLIRPGVEKPETVDLGKMLEQGDMSQNVALHAGDTVVVPEAGRITIAGEVAQPTTLYPGTGMTVLEAIVKAGGFTPRAGLRNVQLRRDGQVCQVDAEEMWRRGNLAGNMALLPNDVIIVPKAADEEVLFVGAVLRPGTIDIREQEQPTLLKLLAAAGRAVNADCTRVSIYRADELVVANAQLAMEKGDMRGNPTLQPGDVVYVPEVGKVALLGAFGRPGLYDYDPKLTFLQYLTTGGLPPPSVAKIDKGMVIRTRPDGTYETTPFDASKITKGQVPDPVKILPGDVIYVEGKGPPKADLWTQIRDVLLTLGAVRGLTSF